MRRICRQGQGTKLGCLIRWTRLVVKSKTRTNGTNAMNESKDPWLKDTPCHTGQYGCVQDPHCNKRPVVRNLRGDRYHYVRMSGRSAGPKGKSNYCAVAMANELKPLSKSITYDPRTTVMTVCGQVHEKVCIPIWHESWASKMNCPDCRRILRDAGFDPDLEDQGQTKQTAAKHQGPKSC